MESRVINCVCQETISKVSGLMQEKFKLLKAVSLKSGCDIVGYLWIVLNLGRDLNPMTHVLTFKRQSEV